MIQVLPAEIAEKLDDATPACDAASDAEVQAFLDEHTAASRPGLLNGWVKALGKHFAEHASRHGATVSVMAGALKEARAGYFSAQDAVDTLRPMFVEEVAKPPASADQNAARHGKVAEDEFNGILAWAVGQANAANLDEVRARVDAQMPDNTSWMFSVNGQTAAGAVKIDETALWNAYPELTSCRDYARSVRVGPLAMLGAALTFASATIPPNVVLPGTVGDYASVNLYTNLLGESGSIKSAAIAAAQVWLNTVPAPDPIKPGSGQGIAKCFAYVKRTKCGSEQVGKRWNAVAVIAEVDTLTAAGSMTGSSLWAGLRSAWSDERVGHDYADVTKSVVLQPRRYRLCMIVGVQPLRAGPLFEDVDAGTPQRFVWFPVDDPGAPEQRPQPSKTLDLPEWPGTTVATFFDNHVQMLHEPVDRSTLHVLKIPVEATEAVDAVARGKLCGNKGVDPLDGHLLLCQLKVAAALMRLCNRIDEITSTDWELAGIVMAVSARTRAQARARLDAERNRLNLDTAKASGARKIFETRMAAAAEAEDIARVADVIIAALTNASGHTMTGSAVRKAVAGRDRTLVPKALEYLEIDGRIQIEEIQRGVQTGAKVTLIDAAGQTK